MQLIHWSREPLTEVHDTVQNELEAGIHWKPRGLWVSAGDGEDSWRAWCEGEKYGLDSFVHKTEVILRPEANVLRVTGQLELEEFDRRYRFTPYPGLDDMSINWPKVAEEHDGIIIAPYVWAKRLSNLSWYYTWDCASGCIWRARGVERLERLMVEEQEAA